MSGSPDDVLRIVRGEPTDAEVAALVVALRSLDGPPAPAPAPSPWGDPARRLRSWGRPGRSARG